MKLIVAVTGASGVIYGKRLLEILSENHVEIFLIVSESAKIVAKHELEDVKAFDGLAEHIYGERDFSAPITSGSFRVDGMVIVPATMKTIGAIASGYCENLVTRSADVQLKERRPLIIVPRETPLNAIHLENMAKLSRLGVTILPAMPGFYGKPKTVAEMVDFIVGRILDQLQIPHNLYKRWGEGNFEG